MNDGNKGKPVYDAAGKIIGRTGEDPKEREITPAERINLGLRQRQLDAANEIGTHVQAMGGLAFEAKRLRDRVAWWDFEGAEKARPKLLELERQYREHHGAVIEHARGLVDKDMKAFSGRVDRQLNIFKECFLDPAEVKSEPTAEERIVSGLKEASPEWLVTDEKTGELKREAVAVAEKCGTKVMDDGTEGAAK